MYLVLLILLFLEPKFKKSLYEKTLHESVAMVS
jgi:hypothetical protein